MTLPVFSVPPVTPFSTEQDKLEFLTVDSWSAYDLANRATLMLDAACRIENDPRSETRQLWQTITGR